MGWGVVWSYTQAEASDQGRDQPPSMHALCPGPGAPTSEVAAADPSATENAPRIMGRGGSGALGRLGCGVPGGERDGWCSGISTDKTGEPHPAAHNLTSTPVSWEWNLTCCAHLLLTPRSPQPLSPAVPGSPGPLLAGLALGVPAQTRWWGAGRYQQEQCPHQPASWAGARRHTGGADFLTPSFLLEFVHRSTFSPFGRQAGVLYTEYPASLQRHKSFRKACLVASVSGKQGKRMPSFLWPPGLQVEAGPALLHHRTPPRSGLREAFPSPPNASGLRGLLEPLQIPRLLLLISSLLD